MKNTTKYMKFFIGVKLLVIVLFLCVNFEGGCDRHGGSSMELQFVPLEEGQGCYYACIYDDGSLSRIKDLSFYGQTNIGGIRRESDDSVNKVELSAVKKIMVREPAFESHRFSDREYMLVAIEYSSGTLIDDLLFPKHVIICGVEEVTGMKRAWFLHKLEKIVIDCDKTAQHEMSHPVIMPRRHRTPEDRAVEKDVFEAQDRALKKQEALKKEVLETKVTTQSSFVPVPDEDKPKEKSLFEAFLGIIDAIIDFFKAIFHTVIKAIGF